MCNLGTRGGGGGGSPPLGFAPAILLLFVSTGIVVQVEKGQALVAFRDGPKEKGRRLRRRRIVVVVHQFALVRRQVAAKGVARGGWVVVISDERAKAFKRRANQSRRGRRKVDAAAGDGIVIIVLSSESRGVDSGGGGGPSQDWRRAAAAGRTSVEERVALVGDGLDDGSGRTSMVRPGRAAIDDRGQEAERTGRTGGWFWAVVVKASASGELESTRRARSGLEATARGSIRLLIGSCLGAGEEKFMMVVGVEI